MLFIILFVDKSEHVKSSSSTVIKPLSILGTEFLLPISKDTSIKPLSILGAEPLPTVSENTSTTVSVGEQSKVGQSNVSICTYQQKRINYVIHLV